jgi:Ca2+/Na+ antiporter
MVGQVVLLAFASAFWPLLVAATVLMLGAPRPLRLLGGYLVGGLIMTVGLGIVILVVLDQSGALSSSNRQTTSPVIDIVAGALLLLIVLAMVTGQDRRFRNRRPPRKTKEEAKKEGPSWTQRILSHDSFWLAFGLGIVLSFPSVYYLAALKDIEEAHGVSAAAIGLVLVFAVVQFLIVEIPLVCFLISPERTRARVDATDRWLKTHSRQVGEVVGAVIGIYLLIRGIVDLVT